MEKTNLVALAITLTVGVILAGSLLAPVIDDVTAQSDTFTNEGYFYVEAADTDGPMTYKFENNTLLINGESVALPTGSSYPDGLTIFYTEHICVRYDSGFFKVRGVANHNCFYLNVTVENGTITGEYQWDSDQAASVVNWTYTEFVGMVGSETDRVMGKSTAHYLNSDSHIETTGLSNFSDIGYAVVHIAGSIGDGVTVKLYNQGSGAELTSLTVSDVTINKTAVEDHLDLYLVDSITFSVSDGEHTATGTYTIYTLPAKVTADRAEPMSTGEVALLQAIPILIIIGMVVVTVGAIFVRNRD